jgi:hypothetical protein
MSLRNDRYEAPYSLSCSFDEPLKHQDWPMAGNILGDADANILDASGGARTNLVPLLMSNNSNQSIALSEISQALNSLVMLSSHDGFQRVIGTSWSKASISL